MSIKIRQCIFLWLTPLTTLKKMDDHRPHFIL